MRTWCGPRRSRQGAPGPSVLELRVHGIGNTPPSIMLDLPAEEVRRTRGDHLGSFWAPTPAAVARLRSTPPGHPDHQPAQVHREAYSWGAMARLSAVPGWAGLGVVVHALVRMLWALLVPFGLANVAYWMRRIPSGPGARGWSGGNGAATIRLFSLALTLLLAASAAAVAMGVVGTQCFLPPRDVAVDGTTVRLAPVCSQLPDAVAAMAGWAPGTRTALLALVPLLTVLLLWAVSKSGQVRLEERMSPGRAREEGRTGAVPADSPVLARSGFWDHRTTATTTQRLHVAAVAALLAAVPSANGVLGGSGACAGISTVLTPACREAVADQLVEPDARVDLGVLAVALVLLVWSAARVCVASEASVDVGGSRPRRRHSGWLLVAALALFAVSEARLVAGSTPAAGPYPLLDAAPATLVCVLLGLAFVALGWRGGLTHTVWVPLLLVGAGGWVVHAGARGVGGWAWWPAAVGTLALVWLAGLVVRAVRRGRGGPEGWAGAGPGVLLLLSAAAGMVFSSLVVLGTTQFLNAPGAAARFSLPDGTTLPGADAVRGPVRVGGAGASIETPLAYAEFGVAAILVLVVGIGAAVPPLVVLLRARHRVPGAGAARRAPASAAQERVQRARRVAAAVQRSELVVGWLAVGCGLSLLLTLVTQVRRVGATPERNPVLVTFGPVPAPPWLVPAEVGVVATTAVGVAALGAVVTMVAGAATGSTRPLGLLWDLLCFLPRTGHPFGPPCYAERVVPELRGRIDAWLSGDEPPAGTGRTVPPPQRRVVLSAHSLGAVLAVATLLARPVDRSTAQIGLVTYGTQLRPYFGRFFPELLGPAVTGTHPCRPPAYTRADPWWRDVTDPLPEQTPAPGSLTALLPADRRGRPAWLNVWRRSDPLGMPVQSYLANGTDRAAEEVLADDYLFTVQAHSGYQRTAAYREALREVLTRLGARDR